MVNRLEIESTIPGEPAHSARKRALSNGVKRFVFGAFSLIVLFATYSAVTLRPGANTKLFPSPISVWSALSGMVADGSLGEAVTSSLKLLAVGYVLGSLSGIIIGSLVGWSRIAEYLIDPIIEMIRPIPALAYIPLVILWFGITESSRIIVIATACFAASVVNVAAGMKEVPSVYIDAASTLGATRFQTFRWVALPSSLPYIFTGLRIAMATGWTTLVAAELLAAQAGLGFQLQVSRQFFRTDQVVLIIIVIGILASFMDRLLRLAQSRLTSWAEVKR